MQMRPVRTATVHLSLPHPSPFVRERTAAKASVVLGLRPGMTFTSADAHSLVTLLAHAVEGLTPEQVSIVDTEGRQLSGAQAVDADIAGRLEYQQRLEAALAAKAEAVLAQVLGVGRSVVRVTAELDFKETTRVETTFDPDGKVKLTEEIETETSTQPKAVVGGPPGTASNLGSVAGKANDSPLLSKREKNRTEYDNARIEDRVTEAPGRITRLTIAAVVHPPEAADGQAAPALDQPALQQLIQQAVGFDPAREDQIAVLLAPPGSAPAPAPLTGDDPWLQSERLLRAASLGLGAIAALIIGGLVLRRLRPVSLPAPAADGVTVDAAHRLAELSQLVREQPDAAARVLRAWLGPESSSSVASPSTRRAA
jgi:flagellar M-ring protein FliF